MMKGEASAVFLVHIRSVKGKRRKKKRNMHASDETRTRGLRIAVLVVEDLILDMRPPS